MIKDTDQRYEQQQNNADARTRGRNQRRPTARMAARWVQSVLIKAWQISAGCSVDRVHGDPVPARMAYERASLAHSPDHQVIIL